MKTRRTIPTLATLACGGLWALFVFLLFVLPWQVAQWEDAQAALPAAAVFLVRMGTFCQRFAFIFLPVLLLLTIGSIAWFALASKTTKKTPS